MKSLSKIFNAIYLCIRFPFLYPRNRFSDENTGLHDILDELRDKESLHVEIGWHPNGYAYSIYRINRRDTEPCYASSERYHNYRECLGAAIVKAMNLAD